MENASQTHMWMSKIGAEAAIHIAQDAEGLIPEIALNATWKISILMMIIFVGIVKMGSMGMC